MIVLEKKIVKRLKSQLAFRDWVLLNLCNILMGVHMFLLAQLPADQLSTQIKNGLILLVIGMAIVFVFLTLLVFSTLGVSKIVRKFEGKRPEEAATVQPQAAPSSAPKMTSTASNDAEIAAAIVAAVAKSKS